MGKPKKIEAPEPSPIATEITAEEAGEESVRRERRRSGRQRTILTGALRPATGGSTTLG